MMSRAAAPPLIAVPPNDVTDLRIVVTDLHALRLGNRNRVLPGPRPAPIQQL